jgi:hypothetical protein
MGNSCCSQKNKDDYNQSLIISKKTCPYCIHVFKSEKECMKHMKKCLYNKGDNSNIYDSNIYNLQHFQTTL